MKNAFLFFVHLVHSFSTSFPEDLPFHKKKLTTANDPQKYQVRMPMASDYPESPHQISSTRAVLRLGHDRSLVKETSVIR